ncbi:anthranilate phosphoribosyltransferase [Promicromonospora sp. NPDC057138]|uniref:anthranilate phosphoribosyltransferase n=1 Tax=Promicromonospora sp. NPDC057138 TaxID=3346031 RepID=UPI00363677D1
MPHAEPRLRPDQHAVTTGIADVPDDRMWPAALDHVVRGHDLTAVDANRVMRRVVRGEATPAQIAGLLTALRTKGETSVEITGFVEALQESAVRVDIPGPTVDIAGTGGDGTGAVNVSTMAAIVAAAAGSTVVKHGGRSASSRTGGAADLVEHLGIPLDLTPDQARQAAANAGIVFLFGPRFNPGLRHAIDARRELGILTVFNTLGPLINPADPQYRVVGVADARMAPTVAEVLAARGRTGLVVRGRDGLDKFTTVTTSDVWIVRDGAISTTVLDPGELGLYRADPADLRGGTAADNAGTFRALLEGRTGPIRDVVLLNAAAVMTATALTREPLVEQLGRAMSKCAAAVDDGSASAALQRLVAISAS